MSESGQLSERPPKDVRVIYHTENRTFARLFNERSLEQLKDVVRRKLGLGQETDVSLKQMGPDALLDLEDDDDFQAFRVMLRFCVSVDIQVTVGRSQGAPVSPPVPPHPREQSTVTEPPVISSLLKKSAAGQSTPRPEVASISQPSTTTKKTPARKRKVSFGDATAATPDKPAERHAQSEIIAGTSVSSAMTAETPSAPKPVDVEEPPKKRQKKEVAKAKGVQPAEGVESPSTKPYSTPKTRAKKSAALDRGSEAATSASKDNDVPEPSAKKPRQRKMNESTVSNMSFPPANSDGMDQSINQTSKSVNDTSLQLEKPTRPSARRGVSKTSQNEDLGVCATIPRTGESANVQSEVAAAILSAYSDILSGIILPPPPPPASRSYVRKTTRKPAASSGKSLAKSTTVSHAPASEIPNVLTEHTPEHVAPTYEPPQQARELDGPPCPICLQEPFHIRYRCPTVLKGPDAIQERLEEVKRTNPGDQQSLIKELEGLLRESEVISDPPPHDIQSREASQPSNASAARTPSIPRNSKLSEVTVESRDEGSSSESSDDTPEERIEHKELPAPGKQKMPDNDDLEAVIRGPALKRQSILGVLDRIVGHEDDKSSDSEEDENENENELQEDQDEEIGRSRRRLFKHMTHSSDSESEEEESRSSSPLRPATDSPKSRVQGSNNPVRESTERQDDDVVMRDCAGPRQDDDSSEETHVGSEDRMIVDDLNREKGAAATVEEELPLGASSNKPRKSEQSRVDSASNQDDSPLVASKIPNEVEADPIEPADDLEPPAISRSSNADPIEAPPEDMGSLFAGASQSTPNPGVTKRIKTRNGQILDDEAEQPVLIEQLTSEATPLPMKGKPRRKVTERSTSQEPVPTRKSPRFGSVPPPTSTPAVAAILNQRSKPGTRSGRAAKTPAKRSLVTEASQSSAKDDSTQDRVRIAPTPSLIRWATLAQPSSSPSLQLDEPSVRIDELRSSSPPAVVPTRGRPSLKETKSRPQKAVVESSQERERLFDLSSSQIPFPYSQYKINPAPAAFLNGNEEREVSAESEVEATVSKKKGAMSARYRSLSQLATDATLFSPTLPKPTTKPVTNGKTKKHVADKDSSSSSTSSDEDEANRSEHIPRGRRAGSALETRKKKKKKSLLSRD